MTARQRGSHHEHQAVSIRLLVALAGVAATGQMRAARALLPPVMPVQWTLESQVQAGRRSEDPPFRSAATEVIFFYYLDVWLILQ